MGFSRAIWLASLVSVVPHVHGARPFTVEEALSAPYASELRAAPVGGLFAWVENAEGRRNLYVGGAKQPARELTHNTADDAQDITQLAWAPNGAAMAYTYGAEMGADGKPANPAHLQRPTPLEVVVQPLARDAKGVVIGEGHAPLFSHDGGSVYFVRDGQIWVARAAAPAEAHQMVFDRGSASQLTLSPDGRLLAFISRRSEHDAPSHSFLALYDLQTHALTFPAPSTGDDLAPAFSPDGKRIAWLRAPFVPLREFGANRMSANPWSIQMEELATGVTRTVFSPEPNKPGSVLPHLAEGGPRLIFAADGAIDFYSEADGWVHLYEVPTDGAPETAWLTPGRFETEGAAVGPEGRRLIYSSNEVAADLLDVDRRHLWELDLKRADSVPVQLTHGDGMETNPQIAADGTVAALVADARTPMHVAIIGSDGSITAMRPKAIPAGYPGGEMVTPKQVLFRSSDGMHLHGQLFLPTQPLAAGAKRAAIVFVHGGPNRQMMLGYTGMDYYSNAYAMNQYLTSLGFVVLSVNYRCGIGYGMDFRECERAGAMGGTEYNDVLAAAQYLHEMPDVDAKRIGIWGGSYGGYLTALALARNSDLFAAGVDFHGVHDWNLEDNAADWKQGSYAERDAIAAKALASSPLGSVEHWTSPVLLIHGDNDPDVAYAETPILAEKLRAQGVPVQELIFPDELHGFLLHKDWVAAYEAAAAFFVRTLKP